MDESSKKRSLLWSFNIFFALLAAALVWGFIFLVSTAEWALKVRYWVSSLDGHVPPAIWINVLVLSLATMLNFVLPKIASIKQSKLQREKMRLYTLNTILGSVAGFLLIMGLRSETGVEKYALLIGGILVLFTNHLIIKRFVKDALLIIELKHTK